MSLSWTGPEKTLLETVRSTLSTREIATLLKILGFTRSTDAIQKQSKKLGVYFKDFGEPALHGLTDKEKGAIQVVLLERETHTEAVEAPKTPFAKGNLTSEKNKALDAIVEGLKDIRSKVTRAGSITTKRASSDKESIIILLSDWHMGEKVNDTETGEEIYNMDIALERVSCTPALIAAAVTPERLANMDEAVILLAGDMVTGEGIFPHQEMALETHAAQQTLETTKALWSLIQQFRVTFPLTRIFTTKGNHGRTAHSPEANWDNIVYQELELLIDLDKGNDVSIKNRYGDLNVLEVKGWKGIIRHTAPVQAETPGALAKFAGWYGIHDWDFLAYGHYHHWGVTSWMGKPIIRNGCLSGGDEYAEGLAHNDPPTQLCFGVSEEKVGTFFCPLYY